MTHPSSSTNQCTATHQIQANHESPANDKSRASHPSSVDLIDFYGKPLWLKRDDLLPEPFSGNKGRKFASLLSGDFPAVTTLISYGSPQSNSLYSMAALAQRRGWQLEFYVDHIAGSLFRGETGNFGGAIAMGAKVLEVPLKGMSARSYIETERLNRPDRQQLLYIPEGGRCSLARAGVHQLGREIVDFAREQRLSSLNVFLPSGTGSTALYLSEFFGQEALRCQQTVFSEPLFTKPPSVDTPYPQPSFQVVTCPVVGDAAYLQEQFAELSMDESIYPKVVGARHHYAKLRREELEIWAKMKQQGIEFELLYDPCGLLVLKALMDSEPGPWLYVHQGGLRGNVSMLPRYRRKYPEFFHLSENEFQVAEVPGDGSVWSRKCQVAD
ncbi:1-aminocyclopropane-1-carboxylate deaminase/D-cysteine desulfhydrase [Shewanella sp. JM162201]|uniref:1-aminocyclopropane-1-carboxylate deaminase/D-cysteine desulfhydrase n=1 Tax=Shewanella jiangmenensis TaxID=2837387 RepID=A0ABS5V772_9GAMM|nr:pyridoxal-phosphate dependent enzyme [Shewanella jiangmenensis]MBT1445676.1 1-aminocyclopropane-1-carboxylate deaminase/D-cysteine desulfhydrase [Shewanella jiangmenensis]